MSSGGPVGPELDAILKRFGVSSLDDLVAVTQHYRSFPTVGGGASPGIHGAVWYMIERAIALAIGIPAAEALRPLATSLGQDMWKVDPAKALSPGTVASIMAQELADPAWAHEEASASGMAAPRFDRLVQSRLKAPASGELVQLLRRKSITLEDAIFGLQKQSIDPRWRLPLLALQDSPLAPAEIATAIHRNIIPGPGLIVTEPPTTPGRVPQVPQSTIDPIVQAEWSGLDAEKLRVLV